MKEMVEKYVREMVNEYPEDIEDGMVIAIYGDAEYISEDPEDGEKVAEVEFYEDGRLEWNGCREVEVPCWGYSVTMVK